MLYCSSSSAGSKRCHQLVKEDLVGGSGSGRDGVFQSSDMMALNGPGSGELSTSKLNWKGPSQEQEECHR